MGNTIGISTKEDSDYISLTDMARYKDVERTNYIIQNWMRNRDTIEFIGLWENMHNAHFKSIEFDAFKNRAGSNSFSLTPKKWIQNTNAVGIVSKPGRYGGTYAHRDIAFEFGSWLSPAFKLYLITEYQRLKDMEAKVNNLEWNVKRIISKANYHIHTDAVQKHILPKKNYSKDKEWIAYAEEADIINVALFGCTAKDWESVNTNHADKNINMRDFATINELTILSNIESLNAVLIQNKVSASDRFIQLKEVADYQLGILQMKLPQKDIGSLTAME